VKARVRWTVWITMSLGVYLFFAPEFWAVDGDAVSSQNSRMVSVCIISVTVWTLGVPKSEVAEWIKVVLEALDGLHSIRSLALVLLLDWAAERTHEGYRRLERKTDSEAASRLMATVAAVEPQVLYEALQAEMELFRKCGGRGRGQATSSGQLPSSGAIRCAQCSGIPR
jgi:hypothetical protein